MRCARDVPILEVLCRRRPSCFSTTALRFCAGDNVYKCHQEEIDARALRPNGSTTAQTNRQMSSLGCPHDILPLDCPDFGSVASSCPQKVSSRGHLNVIPFLKLKCCAGCPGDPQGAQRRCGIIFESVSDAKCVERGRWRRGVEADLERGRED